MNDTIFQQLAAAWNWQQAHYVPIAAGLINRTWKVITPEQNWLLQGVNTQVFPAPEKIDANLQLLKNYLSQTEPDYLFAAPVAHRGGSSLLKLDDEVYRVFPWIEGSHTVPVADQSQLAMEAARCFGDFTFRLRGFPAKKLHTILPGFHDLQLRYQQLELALKDGQANRISETREMIAVLQDAQYLVKKYQSFIHHPDASIRVTHHDTKISNVLFDDKHKGLAVIDLDTLMPGYFISDVGDMFRTYVSPVSEEEKNLDLIFVRKEYNTAIAKGYLHAMGTELSSFEQDHLFFGGEMLIYMQALRFLTDYLQMDVYYGSSYPGQNRVRAENQTRLLLLFQESLR